MFDKTRLENQLTKFPGNYECHITVLIDSSEFSTFEKRCKSLGAKALIIELDAGQSAIQPMLCMRLHAEAQEVLDRICGMVRVLAQDFKVQRVKVEASISNRNIPATFEETIGLAKDCYFEHHIKLELPLGFDVNQLKQSIKPLAGHLSRNPLSSGNDTEHRFITQRFYRCTLSQAGAELERLERYLLKAEIRIIQIIREFNIYDSNVGLDAGWINEDAE